jgi:hypothetical protein
VLKTGLFSVNGALLGALWLLFPQVPLWAQIVATALGCARVMAFFFVPVMERMHAKKIALCALQPALRRRRVGRAARAHLFWRA